MARPKGLAKTGGRQPGTPNKKTHELVVKLERLGCDPIAGLAQFAMDSETSRELRVRCYTELAQYVHPKRKAMELGPGKDGEPLKIVVERVGM
jgi:hypothetical protein